MRQDQTKQDRVRKITAQEIRADKRVFRTPFWPLPAATPRTRHAVEKGENESQIPTVLEVLLFQFYSCASHTTGESDLG